ncbi:MAG: hypothetical protein SF172_10720 [Burkholderiales bacterium]|nr:hypothetical protein [Burkholderiales bacterium]
MSDQERIEKAIELLKRHKIGQIAACLLNEGYRFESNKDITFERSAVRDYLEASTRGVVLKFHRHEIVVVTTQFKASVVPDPDFDEQDADGMIYFDGELVLRIGATKSFDRYSHRIQFSMHPFALKSLKAGPWLEMLGNCYDILEDDHKRRQLEEVLERQRKQANEIDLGNY